ncbi:VCBS repeat-containing protein [Lentzea sp. BCCO 10_0856]|uniref:VCBS repeat-containing protein n=1 Tax=Lentzea miocenica TaxID=3095431 RepID=A0ABU4T249_9PSEU|nr:VCBS repeat-containing protein [Lentzea sp. BCCO 10_0856]MDX8032242.1 VCBS repeat-containing protein [Lentzea sp. BCCO 10_0856]
MQQKLRGGGSRNVARVLAAFAAALVAVSLVPGGASAAAAPKPPKHAEIKMHMMPAKKTGEFGTASASSGGNAGDWNGDTKHDILARQADNGALKVYQHHGTYAGTGTYEPAVDINYGWNGMRWIGSGRINADALSDVVAIDHGGVMRVYEHSGSFNGTSTLGTVTTVGTGWYINDLVFIHDVTGDGFGDIMARRTGTDTLYIYPHTGVINGTSTFGAPQVLVTGVKDDVELNMADVTKDGVPDLLFLANDGWLGAFSPTNGGHVWWLSYGWETMNAVSLADVNFDGSTDILGRTQGGVLQAYRHTGTFSPTGEYTAFNTFLAPESLGWGWNTNNVIS